VFCIYFVLQYLCVPEKHLILIYTLSDQLHILHGSHMHMVSKETAQLSVDCQNQCKLCSASGGICSPHISHTNLINISRNNGSEPMYEVAVMHCLQATCYITSNVQQNTLLINALMIGPVTAKICLHISLYTVHQPYLQARNALCYIKFQHKKNTASLQKVQST